MGDEMKRTVNDIDQWMDLCSRSFMPEGSVVTDSRGVKYLKLHWHAPVQGGGGDEVVRMYDGVILHPSWMEFPVTAAPTEEKKP